MKWSLPMIVAWMCAAGLSHAQIYADFTVSHGGSSLGTFRVRLDYDKAPRTCANFIGLATGQRAWLDTTTGAIKSGVPYYNGLKFHRLDHDFVIQGGDPQGTGGGGPGYSFQDEFHSSLRHSGRYILSMANSGTNTNGSQFFITLASASGLDDKHSVFGEVINDATYPSSRSIIDGFTNASVFQVSGETPQQDIVMDSVTISGPSLAGFNIDDPAHLLPTVRSINTPVSYSPSAGEYVMTWDRKEGAEYLASLSTNLSTWGFTANRFLISLNAATGWQYTISPVTGDRLFSRLVEVDYGLSPVAPADLASNGKQIAISMGNGETVTLTFNATGTGTWAHSGGGSGSLTAVTWQDSAPATGMFASASPQAKFIPLGRLAVTFDGPVGTEGWHSFNLPISFHTATTGWTDGSAVVDNPSGSGTVTVGKRVPFTFTP